MDTICRGDIRLSAIMNVEFISGILAGAAGIAHAERGIARTVSGQGAAGSQRTAESVCQSPETGDRDADGRQAWSASRPDPAEADEATQPPALSANNDTRGGRLDLIG